MFAESSQLNTYIDSNCTLKPGWWQVLIMHAEFPVSYRTSFLSKNRQLTIFRSLRKDFRIIRENKEELGSTI